MPIRKAARSLSELFCSLEERKNFFALPTYFHLCFVSFSRIQMFQCYQMRFSWVLFVRNNQPFLFYKKMETNSDAFSLLFKLLIESQWLITTNNPMQQNRDNARNWIQTRSDAFIDVSLLSIIPLRASLSHIFYCFFFLLQLSLVRVTQRRELNIDENEEELRFCT